MSQPEEWDYPETAEERGAAEQLRRALDGAGAGAGVELELEVAALLRASGGEDGRWSNERAARGWARVAGVVAGAEAGAEAGADAVARRRRRWRRGALSAAAAAAAAVVVVLLVGERGANVTRLPALGVALLKAQTEAAGRGRSIAGLGDEMQKFRAQMYAALAERYREAR